MAGESRRGERLRLGIWAAGVAAAALVAGTRPWDRAAPHVAKQSVLPKLPLTFEQNRGQTADSVRFVTRAAGATMWLADDEAVLAFSSAEKGVADVLRMSFVGSAPPTTQGRAPTPSRSRYFRAGAKIEEVPHFSEVVQQGVYPGVDVRWHGEDGKLEYDVVLAAGVDPGIVRVAMKGADGLSVAQSGDLLVAVGGREIVQHAPVAYQMNGETREPVEAEFVARGTEFGFRLGGYDASRPVVIDPTVAFATYLGGAGNETVNGMVVDPATSAPIVCGGTTSLDFPLGFGHVPTAPRGLMDAYVAKLDPSGAFVQWAVYLDGTAYDEAFGVAVDPNTHNVWVCGETYSTDFTTFQPTQSSSAGGWDGFVAEIEGGGNAILFCTYVGGAGDDHPREIAVGESVFVTGFTDSTDFPLVDPAQDHFGGGGHDGFLTSWDRNAPQDGIESSTYVGGTGDDLGAHVAAIAGDPTAGSPGTEDVVGNGGFQTGGGSFSGWGTSDLASPLCPLGVESAGYAGAFFDVTPTEGGHAVHSGFGGIDGAGGTIEIYQDLEIPPSSDEGRLTFDWRAAWNLFQFPDRTFDVEFQPLGGGPAIQSQRLLTATHSVILGQPVTLNFDDLVIDELDEASVPTPYGGLLIDARYRVTAGTESLPAHSGPNAIVPDSSGLAIIAVGDGLGWYGGVVDGAWVAGNATVHWEQRDFYGELLATSSSVVLSSTPVFIPTAFDEDTYFYALIIEGGEGQVAVDDLQARFYTGDHDTGPQSESLDFDLTPYAGEGLRVVFKLTVPEGGGGEGGGENESADVGPGQGQFQLDNVQFQAAKGGVVVVGKTNSLDYPRGEEFPQSSFGGSTDVFITQYGRDGTNASFSGTLGGKGEDELADVAFSPNGDVAVVGKTNSLDFPRVNAAQGGRQGTEDAFVAKVVNGGTMVEFATYIGGGGVDQANAVAIDATTGDVYVTGKTNSLDFPKTSDALQEDLGGFGHFDAFVVRFGSITNAFGVTQPGTLLYSSYLGGGEDDVGTAIAVSPTGSAVFVAGNTFSPSGMPVFSAVQEELSGESDAFVAKMNGSGLFAAGNLSVDARSPDTVALEWRTRPTLATQLVVRRTGPDGKTTDVATLAPADTQYADTGLAADTSYAYTVVAVDRDGTTTPSNVAATITLPYPPATPTGLAASVSGSRVSLTWTDASTNETGFEIQSSTGAAYETVARVKAGAIRFDKTVIASAAADVTWRVVAVNRGGSSAPSNPVATAVAPTLQIKQLTGSLNDAKASGADRFSVSGRLAGASRFDPNTQALRIEFGSADKPVVLAVPAASRGWSAKRGKLVFSSARSFVGGARFQLVLDPTKETFSLAVSGFEFPTAVVNPIRLGLALGDEAGAASSAWRANGARKLVLR
jgi:hypothetical protein